jgi:bis(5'-nucleosyl)-tetraphosphatase (symmetrical)
MAVYAIGDVQGCFDELQALLDQIRFDPSTDRLWFAGDLVNRGPKSLETLRFARSLNAVSVLGNHDLHLLASAFLPHRRKRKDTLQQVLDAPDADELLDWLRRRPLLHHDDTLGYTLIHAGLPPQWDRQTATDCAAEVEEVLRGEGYVEFFSVMYGNEPDTWTPALAGYDRLRFITNCFTRLRYCDSGGRVALEEKGPPGSQPRHLRPWFEWEHRESRDMSIIFGHWSTLGGYEAPGIHALDTGCLWGGQLTALRLDTGNNERTECPCPGAAAPSLV